MKLQKKIHTYNIKKIIIYVLVTGMLLLVGMGEKAFSTGNVQNSQLIIALDPGHGGEEDGACYYGIREQDINYEVAQKVKKELEQYLNVTVILTREDEETVSLFQRAERARAEDADILISLHFNASNSHKSEGASVYVTTGKQYCEGMQRLADNLLGEFEALGLQNAGTFARVTQMGERREEGSFNDYYGILRHAYNNGMPSVLIEHCYMDSQRDKAFIQSANGLNQLAKADANGIAAYYGLQKKDGSKVEKRHAKVFGGTTKGVENNCFEAPNIKGIRLIGYDGITPGIATYEIEVEDSVGIASMYLVYRNEKGETATVFLNRQEEIKTGIYQLKTYIPAHLTVGEYTLCYIGAYNICGYDAGYNYENGVMVGYGKCDWLNTFLYSQEADLNIKKRGGVSEAYVAKLEEKMQDEMTAIKFYPK